MTKKTKDVTKIALPDVALGDLALLEYTRQTFQKHRIQMGNRLSAIERGESDAAATVPTYFMDIFAELEQSTTKLIADAVKEHEMWDWFDRVQGVGPGLAGILLANIDIEKAHTVSGMWKYCGMGVTNGESDRLRKGEKLGYNKTLKRTCFLIATSFMRADSPYRAEYEEAKARYELTRPQWTPGHRHAAAQRKMVKLFLSHLWTEWRTRRGLPVSQPYAYAMLDHDADNLKPASRYLIPAKKDKATR